MTFTDTALRFASNQWSAKSINVNTISIFFHPLWIFTRQKYFFSKHFQSKSLYHLWKFFSLCLKKKARRKSCVITSFHVTSRSQHGSLGSFIAERCSITWNQSARLVSSADWFGGCSGFYKTDDFQTLKSSAVSKSRSRCSARKFSAFSWFCLFVWRWRKITENWSTKWRTIAAIGKRSRTFTRSTLLGTTS